MAEGHTLSDPAHVGLDYQGRRTQPATALCILVREQVALPLAITLHLAGGGKFKPL